MEPIWDGLTRPETLGEEPVRVRQGLARAAKNYDWPRVMAILSEHQELINTTRPGSSSLYAPLHQAAHGGAPPELVHRLIGLGAWRTLQNGRGIAPEGSKPACINSWCKTRTGIWFASRPISANGQRAEDSPDGRSGRAHVCAMPRESHGSNPL
jgi:hypothetical protein